MLDEPPPATAFTPPNMSFFAATESFGGSTTTSFFGKLTPPVSFAATVGDFSALLRIGFTGSGAASGSFAATGTLKAGLRTGLLSTTGSGALGSFG